MKRSEYLKKIMDDYELDPDDIARILSFFGQYTSVYYVNAWLSEDNAKKISYARLRVLQLSCYVFEKAGKWPDPCTRELI